MRGGRGGTHVACASNGTIASCRARRVLGESHETTLRMRTIYARSLYSDDDATLDDLREAVTTLEDTERIARRVLGGANPTTAAIEFCLRESRAALSEREI